MGGGLVGGLRAPSVVPSDVRNDEPVEDAVEIRGRPADEDEHDEDRRIDRRRRGPAAPTSAARAATGGGGSTTVGVRERRRELGRVVGRVGGRRVGGCRTPVSGSPGRSVNRRFLQPPAARASARAAPVPLHPVLALEQGQLVVGPAHSRRRAVPEGLGAGVVGAAGQRVGRGARSTGRRRTRSPGGGPRPRTASGRRRPARAWSPTRRRAAPAPRLPRRAGRSLRRRPLNRPCRDPDHAEVLGGEARDRGKVTGSSMKSVWP